jgi:hypothetical protein
MKGTTQNILTAINNESVNNSIEKLKISEAAYSHNEMTKEEAIDLYVYNIDLLQKAAEKDILDKLTYTRRVSIFNALKNIENHLNSLAQFNFNPNNRNALPYIQAVITGIISLSDTVENCKILEGLKGYASYSSESKELSKTKTTYNSLLNSINNADEINNKSMVIYNTLKSNADDLKKLSNELETEKIKAQKVKAEIDSTLELVKKSNQEIEDKKVRVSTFAKNIDEYTESISRLEKEAETIIEKDKIIQSLISQAEKALNLKSAEGISAAFSAHYNKINENNTLTKWIFGAVILIVIAIGLTVWIVIGNNSEAISAIIGRVVAVGIAITGATFCAKQYIKQKNIIEDYAYKSVLAKSIIAFTEEIKKRDDKKVAEYLGKVLEEIHRDPLRYRGNHEDKNVGLDATDVFEKCLNALAKK